jgi:uncharacterized GH25 family protein
MRRVFLALLAATLTTTVARAHFVFVLPGADGKSAEVVFSDELGVDEKIPAEKFARTTLTVQNEKGESQKLDLKKGAHAMTAVLPAAEGRAFTVVAGKTDYGVFQRGENKPMRLTYYPKLVRGTVPAGGARGPEGTPLEIVPAYSKEKGLTLQVLLAGKPLADVEVTVLRKGVEGREKLTTDKEGIVRVSGGKPGLLGAYAGHKEEKPGEEGGKKYDVDAHYASVVFEAPAGE